MLDHYSELFLHYRLTLARMLVIVPLLVLGLTIVDRIVSPVFTASATVSMAPTRVELAYSDAWSKQNPGRPTEISVQTFIEFLHSTPVLEIAADKIRRSSQRSEAPGERSIVGDWLDRLSQAFSYYVSKIYHTLNFGKFVELTPEEGMLNSLRSALEVEPVTGTFLLRINVSHEDPLFAAIAADAMAEAYVEHASALASSRASMLRAALEQQADKLAEELDALDRSRATVLQTQGPSGIEAFNRRVQRAEEELRAARARVLSVDFEAADTRSAIQVIEPADVPRYPRSPRMLFAFLAAILGTASLGVVGVIVLDLFGSKITTSFQMHRLAGSAFLGALIDENETPRRWWNPLLLIQGSYDQRVVDLRGALSAHALFDEKEIFVAGVVGPKEADVALRRMRQALGDGSWAIAPPGGGRDEGDTATSLPRGVPKLTLLPALSDRFQWSAVAAPPASALVISVPAGVVSAERVMQVREQAAQYGGLRLFFFFVRLGRTA